MTVVSQMKEPVVLQSVMQTIASLTNVTMAAVIIIEANTHISLKYKSYAWSDYGSTEHQLVDGSANNNGHRITY
jgi:ABC-type branched-subunit amino acid transport system ATPase component